MRIMEGRRQRLVGGQKSHLEAVGLDVRGELSEEAGEGLEAGALGGPPGVEELHHVGEAGGVRQGKKAGG